MPEVTRDLRLTSVDGRRKTSQNLLKLLNAIDCIYRIYRYDGRSGL